MVCQTDTSGASYTAGSGISISGNTISATNGGGGGGGPFSVTAVAVNATLGGGGIKTVSCNNPGEVITGTGVYGGVGSQAACESFSNNGRTCKGFFNDFSFIYCAKY